MPPGSYGTHTRGLDYGDGEMLNEVGSDIRVQDSVCLLGEDWVQSAWAGQLGRVPEGALVLNASYFNVKDENMSAFSLSVAERASIALRSQSALSNANSIRWMWGGTVLQRRKQYLH